MNFWRTTIPPERLATVAIVFGGMLWGLFWLPLRTLGEQGLAGAWPGVILYAASSLVLLPFVFFRLRTLKTYWRPLLLSGLFTGTAFACYATSLLLTEVVRCILLFYLTPIWSTLFGILLLGERLTLPRLAALVVGFVGMLVVLGLGLHFPWPQNLGDWLALASGVAWAYGSSRLYQMGSVATLEQILSFVVGGVVISLLAVTFGGAAFGGLPSVDVIYSTIPFGVLSLLYMLPMLFLTIWPTTILSPGRVGILLMGEVVVGVSSAAYLAGEPFGLREVIGTLFDYFRRRPGGFRPPELIPILADHRSPPMGRIGALVTGYFFNAPGPIDDCRVILNQSKEP